MTEEQKIYCLTILLETKLLDCSLLFRGCESFMLAQGMGLNQVTALAKALNQETEYAGDRLMGKKRGKRELC